MKLHLFGYRLILENGVYSDFQRLCNRLERTYSQSSTRCVSALPAGFGEWVFSVLTVDENFTDVFGRFVNNFCSGISRTLDLKLEINHKII